MKKILLLFSLIICFLTVNIYSFNALDEPTRVIWYKFITIDGTVLFSTSVTTGTVIGESGQPAITDSQLYSFLEQQFKNRVDQDTYNNFIVYRPSSSDNYYDNIYTNDDLYDFSNPDHIVQSDNPRFLSVVVYSTPTDPDDPDDPDDPTNPDDPTDPDQPIILDNNVLYKIYYLLIGLFVIVCYTNFVKPIVKNLNFYE